MSSTIQGTIISSLSGSNTYYFDNEDLDQDLSLINAPKLFGRDVEASMLKNCFQQLSLQENKKLVRVLVHGESGSGKTSLIDCLRQPVLDSQGFFVCGKYFQDTGNQEPYSAIMTAFSDLCDLVCQSNDCSEDRKQKIQNYLSFDHAWLLEKAISNISPFLDKTKHESSLEGCTDVRSSVMFSTFKEACKSFLKAMSCEKHQLVLFIDDIQWMDESSKQLITFLWNDQELSNIMLILAYRDENADSVSSMLRSLSHVNNTVDIGLKNLEINDIHDLVSSLVASSSISDNQALTEILKIKTGGNPFHIVQLIEVAEKEGFLSYDSEAKLWEFDIDSIQSQIMISNSLAELLERKARFLSCEIQENLKIASMLGFCFDEEMITEVKASLFSYLSGNCRRDEAYSMASSSVSTTLDEALKGGFIERCKSGYQFSHDKLQAAFQTMLNENEASQLHGIIADIYADRGDPESIYHAVNHLKLCKEAIENNKERVKHAEMYLTAANFCKDKSAFIQASELLSLGLDFLDNNNKWESHFDLTFEMTEKLAKAELIIGNFESCSSLALVVLDHAKTKEMKVNALVTYVECFMAQNDVHASTKASKQALKDLGIIIPSTISFWHMASKYTKVKWLIGFKSDEDLLALPPLADKVLSTVVQLLVHLCMFCLLSGEELHGAYAALLATEMTLSYGLSPYSPSAFAIFGVAELSKGSYPRAYRFGTLALKMLNQLESNVAAPYTTGVVLSLLKHWYDPFRDMPSELRKAAQQGFNMGDVVNASFCLGVSYSLELSLGKNLEYLEGIMRGNDSKIRENSKSILLMWAQPCIQYVINLRKSRPEEWREMLTLSGEFMDEESFVRQVMEAKHLTLLAIAWTYKCILANSFGYYTEAEAIFQSVVGLNDSVHYAFGALVLYFHGAMASYSLYAEKHKKLHLKCARKYRAAIAKTKKRGNQNVSIYLTLLDAEELSIKKNAKMKMVQEIYDKAIDSAASQEISHLKALGNVRAGFFFARKGNPEEAEVYFKRGMDVYLNEWGSPVLYEWLQERSEKVLQPFRSKGYELVGNVIDLDDNSEEDSAQDP